MVNVYKISSVPIVDSEQQYQGMIHKRDILFLLRDNNFELLGKNVKEFMNFVASEKSKLKIGAFKGPEFFKSEDLFRSVIEKLVFAPGNRLI